MAKNQRVFTTADQRNRIREMAALGHTKREIAEELGITKWQVDYRLMRDRQDAKKLGLFPDQSHPTPPVAVMMPPPPQPPTRSVADERVALIRKVLEGTSLSTQDRVQVVQSLVAM